MTLPETPLHVICDRDACAARGWDITDFASACLNGGARVLQVRAKHASSQWLLEHTRVLVAMAKPFGAVVIVNDRADIARMGEADGVHVGQDDLSPAQVRLVVGQDAIVGRSTHTAEQIGRAVAEPVTYLAIGPVFETNSKATGYSAVGFEGVRSAADRARSSGRRVVAIGGVTIDRAPAVIAAGAAAVAVIADLLSTGDPEARVRAYLQRLTSG